MKQRDLINLLNRASAVVEDHRCESQQDKLELAHDLYLAATELGDLDNLFLDRRMTQ